MFDPDTLFSFRPLAAFLTAAGFLAASPLSATPLAGDGCAPAGAVAPHLSIRPDGLGGLDLVLEDGPGGGQAFVLGLDPSSLPALPTRPHLPGCAGQARGTLLQTLTLDASGGFALSLVGTNFAADRPVLSVVCLPVGGGLLDSFLSNSVAFEPHTGDPGYQSGRVIVTEFMKDPAAVSDTKGEWVELMNPTTQPIDVEGWILMDDGSDSTRLDNGGAGIVIAPQSFLVLGREADPQLNGGVNVDVVLSGFTLSNGDDEILLWSPNGVQADAVRYDDALGWPDDAGRAASLTPGQFHEVLNDVPTGWCSAIDEIVPGGGDTGTPGTMNPTCP